MFSFHRNILGLNIILVTTMAISKLTIWQNIFPKFVRNIYLLPLLDIVLYTKSKIINDVKCFSEIQVTFLRTSTLQTVK